jgi:hypothetical protein
MHRVVVTMSEKIARVLPPLVTPEDEMAWEHGVELKM